MFYNVVSKRYAPDQYQAIHYIKLYQMTSQMITSTWTYRLPVCSVARISDDLTLISAYRNIILIAVHYELPHH